MFCDKDDSLSARIFIPILSSATQQTLQITNSLLKIVFETFNSPTFHLGFSGKDLVRIFRKITSLWAAR